MTTLIRERVVIRLANGEPALHEVAQCGHQYKVPVWALGAWKIRGRCDHCSTPGARAAWDRAVIRRQQKHAADFAKLGQQVWNRMTAPKRSTLVGTAPSPLVPASSLAVLPSCRLCGEPAGRRSGFCSARCERLDTYPPQTCALPECDAEFRTGDTKRRCCTAKHNRRLYRLEHPNPTGFKYADVPIEVRRERWQKRRALKKGASTGSPVRLLEIAERDAWTCQLCNLPVDPDLAYPDPLSKSLDHTIPLSRGGSHDPSNVTLTHLECNVIKGCAV